MIRTIFTTTVAAAAIGFASPVLAGPGHGGGHGTNGAPGQAGSMGRVNSHGPANASSTGIMNANANSVLNSNGSIATNPAVGTSQGPSHASTTGIANANSHSVLAGGAVASSALPGLKSGLNVVNASGANIGTISQVVTDSSGNIRLVVVTSSTGQTFRLAPSTLSISGGTVTTTSTVG